MNDGTGTGKYVGLTIFPDEADSSIICLDTSYKDSNGMFFLKFSLQNNNNTNTLQFKYGQHFNQIYTNDEEIIGMTLWQGIVEYVDVLVQGANIKFVDRWIIEDQPIIPLRLFDCVNIDHYGLALEDPGEICFVAGTLVDTDQGRIPIELLTSKNSINGQFIQAITEVELGQGDYLVNLSKDSLGKNLPNTDTLISKNHGIYLNGTMKRAKFLLNGSSITRNYPTEKTLLYNVLLPKHSQMKINNMTLETLGHGAYKPWMKKKDFK